MADDLRRCGCCGDLVPAGELVQVGPVVYEGFTDRQLAELLGGRLGPLRPGKKLSRRERRKLEERRIGRRVYREGA